MSKFNRIDPYDFCGKPARMIGKEWSLVTAAKGETVNTMTASWGGLGEMWNKPAVFTFIRPQRYTHEFIEAAGGYSVSFFAPEYRGELALCGRVSGRDTDKIKECGFTVQWADGIPYFEQAHTVLLCKKRAVQRLNPAGFLDSAVDGDFYPQRDYHDMYISELTGVLLRGEE